MSGVVRLWRLGHSRGGMVHRDGGYARAALAYILTSPMPERRAPARSVPRESEFRLWVGGPL